MNVRINDANEGILMLRHLTLGKDSFFEHREQE